MLVSNILTLMKLIVTPDYGGLSDITHFNYPLKDLLSRSLKEFGLPLWTDQIGSGFPIAAEGQIGAFSPLNWIIFGILPMPLAFMTALLGTFLIAAIGSYLFARSLKLSKAASVAAALFASFNGYFIVQMTHLNLLQSFSFIPWVLLLSKRLAGSNWRMGLLWLSLVFSQMILVGYPQTFFYSAAMVIIYLVVLFRKKILGMLFKVAGACAIALLLSAVQVVPLVELVAQSIDSEAPVARHLSIFVWRSKSWDI